LNLCAKVSLFYDMTKGNAQNIPFCAKKNKIVILNEVKDLYAFT